MVAVLVESTGQSIGPEIIRARQTNRRSRLDDERSEAGRSPDLMARPGSHSLATVKTVYGVWIFFDANR